MADAPGRVHGQERGGVPSTCTEEAIEEPGGVVQLPKPGRGPEVGAISALSKVSGVWVATGGRLCHDNTAGCL